MVVSVALGGLASYGVFSFSISQIINLLAAFIVAVLINQKTFTIPQTKIKLTAGSLIVFWGIIWLGIPGGILLAAGVSMASCKFVPQNKARWLFDAFVNIVSAFAAGEIFYFILENFAGFSQKAVGENELAFGYILAAAALMVFAQYMVSSVLNFVFFKLDVDSVESSNFSGVDFKSSATILSFSFVSTAILYVLYLEFGSAFTFVILPLVVVGQLAYRLHVERLAQKTKEIMEASRVHLATVEALATAIDARDQMGVGHVRRTQIFAVGIGEAMNLPESELEALNTGALLHDIGKLAVPDHILNKPGRLTPAEMEKIKIHASVSASILENVNFPYPVIPTVKYHHEMWDGNGYPEGLRGEEIPLTARILAVADSFDALRGSRSYRGSVSRDEARRFMMNAAGTQFDPKIVDVFLHNLKKFEAEAEAQGFSYEIDEKDSKTIQTVADDITDLSYVDQIKRANREVFALYELARAFSSSLSLEETLALFVEKIRDLVPFDSCVVYLMDESEEFAKAAYIEGENKSVFKNKCLKIGEGATGFVLKKRQPVYKIEPKLDFSFENSKVAVDYTAMTSLPLIADEQTLGAVSLYSSSLKNYEEEHLRLIETVSRVASDAIYLLVQNVRSESRALTDPMTDLPNARSLQMQFDKEAARAARSGSSFQLLMLDLDGFKAVNDTFGHKAGDKLLKGLAKAMLGQLRDYDFLARYAGDEFVVIVPDSDAEAILELSQRIEKAVIDFALPVGDGAVARVGVSIGAASYPFNGETLETVIIAADKAMYAIKADRKQAKATRQLPSIEGLVEQKADYVVEDFILEIDESHIISKAVN